MLRVVCCHGTSSVRAEDMRVLLVNRVGDRGYRFRAMYGRCARCLMKAKIEAFQAFGGGVVPLAYPENCSSA